MTRLYIVGGVVLAFGTLLWWHMQVAEENARLEYSLSQAGEAIALMERDRKDRESANQQLRQKQEELAHENARLEHDLDNLPRTQAQRDCDAAATPDGYPQRMLEYARSQGPVLDPGPDVGAADRDIPGDRGHGNLRSGEE